MENFENNDYETLLLREIARLEFINDQLEAELQEANTIFESVGFRCGLKTACAAASELQKLSLENS